tara:strand:- start:206 stop:1066 length:861 start_codon:yes stop_codon:yes gene_type:complete
MGALTSYAKKKLKKKAKELAAKKALAKKNAIIAARSKAKKAKASIDDNANEVVGTRERSGSTGNAERDIEEGKAGEVTSGRRSEPSFADMETSSAGRTARNKRVATLETLKEKGTITKAENAELKRLDKLSSDSDKARASKAASTASANARRGKGVTLAGMDGPVTVGRVVKQPSGEMIGDTKNGINKVTGEIFGNPTPNQIDTAMRDVKARTDLSAAARRERLAKLAKAGGRTKEQRQSAAIANMERRLVDTGPDKSGRPYSRGGAIKAKSRTGHSDYRKGGLFK